MNLRYLLARGRKLIGGVLGSLTGPAVAGLFALFGVTVPLEVAGALALAGSWVGTFLAKENAPKMK